MIIFMYVMINIFLQILKLQILTSYIFFHIITFFLYCFL